MHTLFDDQTESEWPTWIMLFLCYGIFVLATVVMAEIYIGLAIIWGYQF